MTHLDRPARRFLCSAGALVLATPVAASAHGEMGLIAPAATVILLLLSGVGLASWGVSARLAVLFAILIGTHAALWFLPMPTTATGLGADFVALVIVPLGAAGLAHVVIRRYW